VLKKLMIVMACVLLLVLVGQCAFAQDTTGLKGRTEIQAAGAWLKTEVGSRKPEVTVIGGNYGTFIAPKIELQGALIYGNAKGLGSTTGHAWLIAPAALYNFVPETPSATVPYIGAGFTYANVSGGGESNDSFKLQYLAGVRFFLGGDYATSNKAVFIEYRHTNVDFGNNAKVDMIWTGISTFLK